MSDNKKHPTVLNRANIRDLIEESHLIREFAMYGCSDTPGRIIGYNPFTKKCVDITGYEGPDAPVRVPVPGGGGGGSIKKLFTDPTNILPFLKDVYLGAFDIDQIVDCATNNPGVSGLGFIVGASKSGKSVVMLLPRVSFAALAPTRIKSSIQASRQLAAYKMQHRGFFRQVADPFLDALKGLRGKAGMVAAVAIGGLGLTTAAFKNFNDMKQKEDVMTFLEWAENEAWGNESYDNWKCLGSAMVLSVALGALGRSGTNGLAKLAGKTLTAPVAIPVKIIKAITRSDAMKSMFSKTLSLSLKGTSTKNLSAFKQLQDANLVPQGAKITLDTTDGAGKLKITGLKGDIRIPADRVPEGLKKASGDGDFILRSDELTQELSQISTKVTENINKQFQGSAKAFKNSPYQKQLKIFKKILDKGGDLSAKSVNSQAFENSVELLNKMYDEAEILASKLSKVEKDLLRQKSKIKSIVNDLSTGTTLPDMKKVEAAVLKADIKEIDSVLSGLYPGASGTKAFEDVKNYFVKFKDFDLTQKELISQLELGKKALLDETGVVKGLMKDKKGNAALNDWLNTGAGQKWANSWNSFPGRKREVLKSITSQPLKNAFSKFLASEDLAIVGAASVAAVIANQPKAKIDNAAELQEVLTTMDAEIENLIFEDYLNSQGDGFDAQKMILTLISKNDPKLANYSASTQTALKEWKKAASGGDKKYVDELNDFVNRAQQGAMPSAIDLKSRLKQVVRGTITPKIQENREVTMMKQKDIRQLVSEVLNENYGKYPYHSNEPSESEPDEDYMVEWSALVDDVCDNKKKNVDGDPNTFEDVTIEVAKILVKDQDLFRDVLEAAGANKSIGVAIMQKLKTAREAKSIDKQKQTQ